VNNYCEYLKLGGRGLKELGSRRCGCGMFLAGLVYMVVG